MSSLEETPGPEMGVSDKGDIQNVQCWGAPRTRFEKHCSSPTMARHHALPIPSSELNFPHSIQSEGTGSVIDTGSSTLAIQTLGGRDTSTAARLAMAPSLWKDLLSQGRGGGRGVFVSLRLS